MSPGALSWVGGVWFSSWYVVSIGTGHIAQSPQSSPRWSPAFKMEPVLFPPSICLAIHESSTWKDTPPHTHITVLSCAVMSDSSQSLGV